MTTVRLREIPCPINTGGRAVRIGGYRWGCTCGQEHMGAPCPDCGYDSLAWWSQKPDVESGWMRCTVGHWVCVRKEQPCPSCRTGMVVGSDRNRVWSCDFCTWQHVMEPAK